MYFIVDDYSVHIFSLPDVRNAKCGFDGGSYCIYVYFKSGSDSPITIPFYNREGRDKAFNDLCERLLELEKI